MALVVNIPFSELRAVEQAGEEWQCEYTFNSKRCASRRVKDDMKYCDVHDRWAQTAMAALGAPLPKDLMSTQLFLAFAMDQVMNQSGTRSDAEIHAIMMLARVMAKNAGYL